MDTRGGRRIIPALAGNTARGFCVPRVRKDHPRSRGEYVNVPLVGGQENGSSPLSRGIQVLGNLPPRVARIIPALAGNTPQSPPPGRVSEDHPRSRGEYAALGFQKVGGSGSSPLSRGILSKSSAPCCESGDHPRSRGEYDTITTAFQQLRGSSPLSRGILIAGTDYADYAMDHPRSRGEYSGSRAGARSWAGSSPLSRGILHPLHAASGARRIIPALAGNTYLFHDLTESPTDHPRSRGEYNVVATVGHNFPGSSPLSRGIPLSLPTMGRP